MIISKNIKTYGRYALIGFKLGSKDIDLGAEHLCEIERLIIEYNKIDLAYKT